MNLPPKTPHLVLLLGKVGVFKETISLENVKMLMNLTMLDAFRSR